jgi:monofunctional glycosyltransferase
VAEFDEGVFGVEAAARHYFGVSAADADRRQAALLAAVLPDPKGRSAAPRPFPFRVARAAADRRRGRHDRGGRAPACFGG